MPEQVYFAQLRLNLQKDQDCKTIRTLNNIVSELRASHAQYINNMERKHQAQLTFANRNFDNTRVANQVVVDQKDATIFHQDMTIQAQLQVSEW